MSLLQAIANLAQSVRTAINEEIVPRLLPEGGAEGQVLTRTPVAAVWADSPAGNGSGLTTEQARQLATLWANAGVNGWTLNAPTLSLSFAGTVASQHVEVVASWNGNIPVAAFVDWGDDSEPQVVLSSGETLEHDYAEAGPITITLTGSSAAGVGTPVQLQGQALAPPELPAQLPATWTFTHSSLYDGSAPTQAALGDLDPAGAFHAQYGVPAFLVADFGALKRLERVRLAASLQGSFNAGYLNGASIEYAFADGVWLPFASVAGHTADEVVEYMAPDGAVPARWVRIAANNYLPISHLSFKEPIAAAAFSVQSTGTQKVGVTNESEFATAWLWDFGDGETSAVHSPSRHVYAATGTYTITLQINGDPALVASHDVTVNEIVPLPTSQYWRVLFTGNPLGFDGYVGIGEFQLLVAGVNQVTPAMLATASAQYSTGAGSAMSAIDGMFGDDGVSWISDGNDPAGAWLAIDAGAAISADELRLYPPGASPGRAPNAFDLQTSTDGSEWTTLQSFVGGSWTSGVPKTFLL